MDRTNASGYQSPQNLKSTAQHSPHKSTGADTYKGHLVIVLNFNFGKKILWGDKETLAHGRLSAKEVCFLVRVGKQQHFFGDARIMSALGD